MDGRGEGAALAEVVEAVRRRDELDSSRAEAPLRAAEDAVTVDTTDLDAAQVTERIVQLVERVRAGRAPVDA